MFALVILISKNSFFIFSYVLFKLKVLEHKICSVHILWILHSCKQ